MNRYNIKELLEKIHYDTNYLLTLRMRLNLILSKNFKIESDYLKVIEMSQEESKEIIKEVMEIENRKMFNEILFLQICESLKIDPYKIKGDIK